MEDLVEMFADHILLLSEEPPVIKFLTRVLSYVPLSKKLLDYILQKPRETKVSAIVLY